MEVKREVIGDDCHKCVNLCHQQCYISCDEGDVIFQPRTGQCL